jgi:hypothetical protein
MTALWIVLGLVVGLITVAARYSMSSTSRKPTAATRASTAHSANVQRAFREIAANPLPDKDPEE